MLNIIVSSLVFLISITVESVSQLMSLVLIWMEFHRL